MERTHHVKKNESKITLVSAKHVWTNDKYIFSSISIQTLTLKFNRVFFFFLSLVDTCWVFNGLGGTNCQWSCEFASSLLFFFLLYFILMSHHCPAVILCGKELFSWCIDIKRTTHVTWPLVYYKPHIYTIGEALEI